MKAWRYVTVAVVDPLRLLPRDKRRCSGLPGLTPVPNIASASEGIYGLRSRRG